MQGRFDPREHGFDDSWCRSHADIGREQERLTYLVMNSGAFHLSLAKDVVAKLNDLGERFDFAKNEDGELVLYPGTARKVSGQTNGNPRRGSVSLTPLKEFYLEKFGPFKRMYMEASEMDGAIRFTPTGKVE